MDYTKILLKPIVTEKSSMLGESLNKYSFVVKRKSNKIEISKAVQEMYGVGVVAVKTMNMPGKDRSKWTNKGYAHGQTSAFKKAVVTVKEGDTIDFYSNI